MAENTRLARRRSDGALRRLDPFEVLNTLRDEMDRLWRDPLRIGALAFPFGSATAPGLTSCRGSTCTSRTTPSW
jgi:hypothetical protein